MTRAGRVAGQLDLLGAHALNVPEHPTIRVVIPCSKWKVQSEASATRQDLDENRAETEARLTAVAQRARDLYTGRAYQRSLAAVDRFSMQRPDMPLALHIASAGYGIVGSEELLVPYEAEMGSLKREWVERGSYLRMPQQALALVESCDLTIFALSQPYFTGASISTILPSRGRGVTIGVGTPTMSPRLSSIIASRPQARGLGTTEREVGSVVLLGLLEQIAARGLDVTGRLSSNPLDWPEV